MSRRLIDPGKPYQPVYSIYKHQFLGCLISVHAVQKLDNGRLSLAHQAIHPNSISLFADKLDEVDKKLIKVLWEISPGEIFKKYGGKSKSESEFYYKNFHNQVRAMVLDAVNRRLGDVMPQLLGKEVYVMGNDGYPAYQKVNVSDEEATVLFHFRKNEDGTRYFPTIKLRGERIDFQYKDAQLISTDPVWMLLGDEVFTFHKNLEGAKLKPFLNKRFIQIPKASEPTYYEKFITQLVERYNVYAKGFEIRTMRETPEFKLYVQDKGEAGIALKLMASYGGKEMAVGKGDQVKAILEKDGSGYLFHRIERQIDRELEINKLMDRIKPSTGLLSWELMTKQEGLAWLGEYAGLLESEGIEIVQPGKEQKLRFDIPTVKMETTEEGDWFGVKAMVKIGKFSIPFLKFKKHILNEQRDFVLPDGTVAILPESWFTDYRHLVEIAEEKEDGSMQIRKYQAGLLDGSAFAPGNGIDLSVLEGTGGQVPEKTLPEGVKATLRSYQKKGYDWLAFLGENSLGGILADDMGLGKTLQTLTLLQEEKEQGNENPSLIVMPTSLLYNWVEEARKFTPGLKLHVHAGMNRAKDAKSFQGCDIVLTTYGTARQDEKMLKKMPFHYLILDESQTIKNPASKTAKAIRNLVAKHRLSLTGTPLENTLMDLWSQMTFLNPGLLGSQNFFKKFYVQPIEKEQDQRKILKLRKIIHPFILRRTKEQVATELPPKVEQVYYCEMSEDQEKLYEETRNAYRNYLLNLTDKKEFNKNKLNILAGLQKLRQIAIHPGLVNGEEGEQEVKDSGKYEEFLRMLGDVMAEGAKVLVFSQFVKLLTIIREDLDQQKIPYCYLDGSTRDRQGQVKRFQEDPEVPVFLISLKAGGVGLNLTAAEYVFILDPWWNPAVEAQAIDRSYRIGQTKTVFSYKFITRNSIEEKILKLQERKANLSAEIVSVEEDVFKKLELADLQDLLS